MNECRLSTEPPGKWACSAAVGPVRLGPAVAVPAMLLVLIASTAARQGPKATITGGADDSRYNYSWVVKNNHNSPIVYVRFPPYRRGLFSGPQGWSNVDTAGAPGGWAPDGEASAGGIAPGASASFTMRVDALKAKRKESSVLIRFADGTETTVTGVETPHRPASLERYSMPIGLAGLGVIWLIVRIVRKKRSPQGPAQTAC